MQRPFFISAARDYGFVLLLVFVVVVVDCVPPLDVPLVPVSVEVLLIVVFDDDVTVEVVFHGCHTSAAITRIATTAMIPPNTPHENPESSLVVVTFVVDTSSRTTVGSVRVTVVLRSSIWLPLSGRSIPTAAAPINVRSAMPL